MHRTRVSSYLQSVEVWQAIVGQKNKLKKKDEESRVVEKQAAGSAEKFGLRAGQ